MPLVAITSVPFHAMTTANGQPIALEKSDLALAQTTASEYPCPNVRVPDASCTVHDLAVHKSTQPEIEGFMAKVAHRLDRIFTLPKNKKSAKTQFYSHFLRTTCAATTGDGWPTSWERVAVSPKAGVPLAGEKGTFSLGHWRAELQRPYMWVQRRYALAAPNHAGAVTDVPACPDPCATGLLKSTRVRGTEDESTVRTAYESLKGAFKLRQSQKKETAPGATKVPQAVVSANTVPLTAVGTGGWEKQPEAGGNWKAHVFTFRCAARLPNLPADAVGVAVLTSPSTDASKAQGLVPLVGHATYALYPPSGPPDQQPHMCRPNEKCSVYNGRAANCLCIPVRTLGGLSNGASRTLTLVETSKNANEADSNQYKFKGRLSSERNAVDVPLVEFNRQYQVSPERLCSFARLRRVHPLPPPPPTHHLRPMRTLDPSRRSSSQTTTTASLLSRPSD